MKNNSSSLSSEISHALKERDSYTRIFQLTEVCKEITD
jgi:hypothetical protein